MEASSHQGIDSSTCSFNTTVYNFLDSKLWVIVPLYTQMWSTSRSLKCLIINCPLLILITPILKNAGYLWADNKSLLIANEDCTFSITCSSFGSLDTRVTSSATVGIPQYNDPRWAPSLRSSNAFSNEFTNTLYAVGDQTPPCRTLLFCNRPWHHPLPFYFRT